MSELQLINILNSKKFTKVAKLLTDQGINVVFSIIGLINKTRSWNKKNISAKKMFKVGDEINCVITEIDKEKRRVAISHRLTKENPFELIEKKFPIGTIVEGEVVNKNEYSFKEQILSQYQPEWNRRKDRWKREIFERERYWGHISGNEYAEGFQIGKLVDFEY